MRAADTAFRGGCARTNSSLTSAPQPGPFGKTRWPSSMTGGAVTISSFHLMSSMSISMTLKFGTAAQKCALIRLPRWPLKLCGATLTS